MADPSFFEGFETLTPDTLPLRFTRQVAAANCVIGTYPYATFPNGRAFKATGLGSGTTPLRRQLTPHASGRLAFRFCLGPTVPAVSPSGVYAMLFFDYSTHQSSQFSIYVDLSTGKMQVRAGPYSYNTLLGETTNGLVFGTVYHIEIAYTISNTVGAVNILVDGVEWLNITNVNTRNYNTINEVNWIGFAVPWGYGTESSGYDDLVWAADATPALGPLSVLVGPANGAGASTQFTPSAGANYECVDDAPGHDSDTSYVESSTDGHEDAYTVAVPDLTGYTVHAVQPMVVARKTDVGAISAAAKLRSGASASTAAAVSLADSYALLEGNIAVVDPDTSAAWVNADVADVQVAVVVETV